MGLFRSVYGVVGLPLGSWVPDGFGEAPLEAFAEDGPFGVAREEKDVSAMSWELSCFMSVGTDGARSLSPRWSILTEVETPRPAPRKKEIFVTCCYGMPGKRALAEGVFGAQRPHSDIDEQVGARGKGRTHVQSFVDGIGDGFHDLTLYGRAVCEIPELIPNGRCSRVVEMELKGA